MDHLRVIRATRPQLNHVHGGRDCMPDRLKKLNDLLRAAEQKADETKQNASDADQLVRDLRAKIASEKKSRRHLRGLSLVPAATWAAHQLHQHAAVAVSTAALILGLGAGLLLGPDQHDHHGAIPTAPAPIPTQEPTPTTASPTGTTPSRSSPSGMAPPGEPMPTPGAPSTPSAATASPPTTSSPSVPSTPPVEVGSTPTPEHVCLLGLDGSVTLAGLEASVRLGLCGTNAA